MICMQESLRLATRPRSTRDVTEMIADVVARSGAVTGLAHVFLRHTSASLLLCENADPQVRRDLERFLSDLVVDGDRRFLHVSEGPDDMPAHVRSVLVGVDLSLPVRDGALALGTWQGVYLWEHRHQSHQRELLITVSGTGTAQ